MMWLLKSKFDQNLIMINHKFNSNFMSHIILKENKSMLMTFMVKDVRYQTRLDIKVEVAFVTTVDKAITIVLKSIANKILTNFRCL